MGIGALVARLRRVGLQIYKKLTKKKYTLGKDEIMRGYKSFDRVYEKSARLENGNVAARYQLCQSSTAYPVRVGFLLSKKKLKNPATGTG